MILVTENNKQYYIYGSMLGNTTRTNSLPSYPTIEGTSFSDHYYREPDSVNFQLKASEVSKSMIYSVETGDDGGRLEKQLSLEEVSELLRRWFKDATRVEVTSIRHYFPNMILQSYSWSDQDLAIFDPTLNFMEARVQTLRTGIIENPDQYYQAAYGGVISVGGAAAVDNPANIGSALMAGATGAAVGAAIGSVIPGIGTAAGAVVGGVIGFFGSLLV